MLTPQSFSLQNRAQAHDIGEILARHRLDAEAAVARSVDKPARGEARQRLAQRRRADPVAGGGLDDAEAASRRQGAGENVGFEPLLCPFGQSFRVGRRQGRTSLLASILVCNMPSWPIV